MASRAAIIMGFVTAAPACFTGPSGVRVQCSENAECDPGWLCFEGRCSRTCAADSGCGPREVCGVVGVCLTLGPPGCTTDAGCVDPGLCQRAVGAACVGGSCVYLPQVCNAPPPDECVLADSTFRAYSALGTCNPTTGTCEYPFRDTACGSCVSICLALCAGVTCDDDAGGCHRSGFCEVDFSPPVVSLCEYELASDGTACEASPGLQGVCDGGVCLRCSTSADCDDSNPCTTDSCAANACINTPNTLVCDDGDPCTYSDVCGQGVCAGTAVTCANDMGSCGLRRTCNGTPTCTEEFAGSGDPCDDGDPCTYDDRCDGGGACGGTAISCTDDPAPCGAQRVCDGTNSCAVTYPTSVTSCDDGNACTHTDRCDGAGACTGTPIVCNDDAGTCGANRSCNGSSSCTVSYPGSGIGCNDGAACTYNDRCNGSGGCGGTPITCNDAAGTCGANRSCNGTSSCTETFPGSGTGCNDGDACTFNDRCNGSGGCGGTLITCNDDASTCGANRACNGTNMCTVTYPGSGTGCNDGNACTGTDRCNGAGGCAGSNLTNGTQCGGTEDRCCSGTCVNTWTSESHCGGCGLACTAGLTCTMFSEGGGTRLGASCQGCSANSQCPPNPGATCWTVGLGGQDRCQCQASGHCAAGQTCYAGTGNNYCHY